MDPSLQNNIKNKIKLRSAYRPTKSVNYAIYETDYVRFYNILQKYANIIVECAIIALNKTFTSP